MTVSETLETAWKALADDVRSDSGIYERRIFASSQHSVFVGLSLPTHSSQFILVVSPKSVRRGLELETKGFRLLVEKSTSSAHIRVRLEETNRAFGDLFKHLCVDVATAILSTTTEQLAVNALRVRLSRWQKFLEEASAGLSELAQIGLYGELYFLKRLLMNGCPPQKALDAWHGPLGANHDFMFGYSAVEVKSTTANNDTVLLIANERQLDDTGLSSLILCSCSFDRREHTAQTLPALIADLAQLLGTDLVPIFEDRLLAVGYHRSQHALYANVGYAERRLAYYQVAGSFPRIVPNDLKPGVHDVQYHAELAAATALLIQESTVMTAVI